MQKFKVKSKLFLVAIIGLLAVTIIGVSYGFYLVSYKSPTVHSVVAGTFNIDYEDGEYINLSETVPMSDIKGMQTEEYTFTISNTGNVDAKYRVLFEQDESINKNLRLSPTQIKYSLKDESGIWSQPELLSDNNLILVDTKELDAEGSNTTSKVTYSIKLWVDENVGNEGQGRTFGGKVVVDAIQGEATIDDFTIMAQPLIVLNGKDVEYVEVGSKYDDPGVKEVLHHSEKIDPDSVKISYEYFDGNTTEVVSSVNTDKVGVYYITYKVEDSKGTQGSIVRTVNVYPKDTNAPVIRLRGESLVTILTGEEFNDEGATASDEEDGDLTSRIVTVGKVNNLRVGTYTIKYLVEDQAGNTSSATRTVIVRDNNYIRVKFVKGPGVSEIGQEEVVCQLEGTNDSCEILLPTITELPGYNKGFFSEDIEALEGELPGTTIRVSKPTTYYAKALDNTKPECRVVSVTPKDIDAKDEAKVVIECTDTSGNVTSNMTEDDITLLTDGEEITLNEKSLSNAESVKDGIRHTLTVKGFSRGGNLSVNIKEGSVSDESGNTNEEVTLKTDATIHKTLTVTYEKGPGVSEISKETDTCEIEDGASSCLIELPTITELPGYEKGYWYENIDTLEDGKAPQSSVTISEDTTFYAVAKDETLPVCKIISAEPTRIDASESTTIVIECSDTSGSVLSSLTANDITPLVGDIEDTPETKILSSGSYTDNIVRHTLQIGGFTRGGKLSLIIAKGKVSDSSDNQNLETTLTTDVVIEKRINVTYETISGVDNVGKSQDYCVLENGQSSCEIELPSITPLTGYDNGLWYEDASGSGEGKAPLTTVQVSTDKTFFAKATDTEQPICSVLSADPKAINRDGQTTIEFECTDTTGIVSSTLTEDDIVVKVGAGEDKPTIKQLGQATQTAKGVKHTLTLGGFGKHGELSFDIPSGKFTDASNNGNQQTTLTPGVNIGDNLTVRFEAGTGVSEVGKPSDYCEVGSGDISCNVELPTITELPGYSNGLWYESANPDGTTEGLRPGTSVTVTEDTTYYAIAKDVEKPTCKIVSSSPNLINKADSTEITIECSDTSGNVTSSLTESDIDIYVDGEMDYPNTKDLTPAVPSEKGVRHTLTVGGFSRKGSLAIELNKGRVSDSSNNTNDKIKLETEVEITNEITAQFKKGAGVKDISNATESCEISNGETTCEVTLPDITELPGYSNGLWYTTEEASGEGLASGTKVKIKDNTTYYAIAKDEEAPECNLVSATPRYVNRDGSVTIIFECSDTSGTVTSELQKDDISITVGGAADTPKEKELSSAITEGSGVRHTLTLGGFNRSGDLAFTIAGGKISDGSHNTNVSKTITPNVTVNDRVTVTLKSSGGVEFIDETIYCDIENGNSSCEITLPDITPIAGYSNPMWYEDSSMSSEGKTPRSRVSVSDDKTFYAIATDTEKPTCSIVSEQPLSLNREESTTIVIECSDTSGSATSFLNTSDFTILVGGQTDEPNIKSSSKTTEDGKVKHTLTLGEFGRSGQVAISIPANKVRDESLNYNIATTLTSKVFVNDRITVKFEKGNGVQSVGDDEITCDVTSDGGCTVQLPDIQSLPGYDDGLWYNNEQGTGIGTSAGQQVTVNESTTYYAIAKDSTAPVCRLSSATPSEIGPEETATVVIECTDTSGSVVPKLQESDLSVLVGGAQDNEVTKTLSSSALSNGVKYNIKLSKFSRVGAVSLSIPTGAVEDGSGNKSAGETFTLGVEVKKRITVYFEPKDGVVSIGEDRKSCDLTGSSKSCSIELPTITSQAGYDDGLWYEDESGSGSGKTPGTSITVTESTTYYAIAKDTTKPVCNFVSAEPDSIAKTETTTVTIDCTDTSGSVTSSLTDSQITVNVGGTTDTGVSKTLREESVDNGIRYKISMSNFTSGGAVSVTIPSGAVHDSSNNPNNAYTASRVVTITDSKKLTIIRKSGITAIGGDTASQVTLTCSVSSGSSCSIDLPELTVANGYDGGAYSTTTNGDGLIQSSNITMTSDTTIYALGYKELELQLRKLTGVTSLASDTASCRAYGSSSCQAMLPLVVGFESGYNSAKYVASRAATTGGYDPGSFITITTTMDGSTYYVIGVKKVTVTLVRGKGVSSINGNQTSTQYLECVSYGDAQCSVDLPDITPSAGYSNPMWVLTGGSAAVSYPPYSTIYPTEDQTYTANAYKDYTLTIKMGTGVRYIDGYARTYTATCSVQSSGTCTISVPSITVNNSYTGGGLVLDSEPTKVLYKQFEDITMTDDAEYTAVGYTDITVSYRYGTGVSRIGRNSDTCELVGSASSCSIELPTITTSASPYVGSYWYEGTSTTGHYENGYNPGDTVSVSSNKTFTAIGTRLVQLQIYRTGSITRINNSTANPYTMSSYAYGSEQARFYLPSTTPASVNGHKSYFSTDSDGIDSVGESGDVYYVSPSNISATPTKVETLYAIIEEPITITFKAYSGAGTSYLNGSSSTTVVTKECYKTGNEESCEVQTPTIYVASGYESGTGMWYEGNNLTTAPENAVGTSGGSYLTVSKSTTYTAVATRMFSVNFYDTVSAKPSGSSGGYATKSCHASGSTGTCKLTTPSITRSSTSYSSTVYYSKSRTGTLSSTAGDDSTPTNDAGSGVQITVSSSSTKTFYAISSRILNRYFYNNDGSAGGIQSIGTQGAVTCTIYGDSTSCSIKSPTITAVSGWLDPQWYPSSDATTGGYPYNATMVLNTTTSGNNATGQSYYARAYRYFYANYHNAPEAGVVQYDTSVSNNCKVFGSTSSCTINLPTITVYAPYFDGAIWTTSKDYDQTSGDQPGAIKVLTAVNQDFYAVGYQIYNANFVLGEGVTSISQNSTTCYSWGIRHACNASTPQITGYAQNYGNGFFTGDQNAQGGVTPGDQILLSGDGTVKEYTVWAKAVKEAITNFAQLLISKSNNSDASGWDSKTPQQHQQPFITIQNSNLVGSDHPMYRFMGNMPENYVYWNGEQWRVIGVESQYSDTDGWNNYVKMIKATSIGGRPWYNSSSRGTDWSGSATNAYLNSTYLVSMTSNVDYLVSMRWYWGGDWESNFSYNSAYEKERQNASEVSYGRAGLINLSDYLGSHMQGYNQTCVNNSDNCNTTPHSWIYDIKGATSQMWTLTANTVGSSAFVIGKDGSVPNHWTDTSYPIFPVVYLKANTIVVGDGVGGSGNHYQIGLG